MKSILVIYDANILIDFCKLRLVSKLFKLGYEFHTVDLVWQELRQEQQLPYLRHIESGQFCIRTINGNEVAEVALVRSSRPQLSFPDCTAMIYAKNHEGILLTSDKNLRSTARQHNVEVHGHLWIFDAFFSDRIMEGNVLCSKLRELCDTVNPRLGLPDEECEKRINEWKTFK